MGWYPLLNYVKNCYLFDKLVIELVGSTIAVEIGQLGGNAHTFLPAIFSADTPDFLVKFLANFSCLVVSCM